MEPMESRAPPAEIVLEVVRYQALLCFTCFKFVRAITKCKAKICRYKISIDVSKNGFSPYTDSDRR